MATLSFSQARAQYLAICDVINTALGNDPEVLRDVAQQVQIQLKTGREFNALEYRPAQYFHELQEFVFPKRPDVVETYRCRVHAYAHALRESGVMSENDWAALDVALRAFNSAFALPQYVPTNTLHEQAPASLEQKAHQQPTPIHPQATPPVAQPNTHLPGYNSYLKTMDALWKTHPEAAIDLYARALAILGGKK